MNETETQAVLEDAAAEYDAPVSVYEESEPSVEEASEPKDAEGAEEFVDYGALATRDIEEIHAHFPDSRHIKTVHALDNPERFAELRDLGLSAYEAYLATQSQRRVRDNRAHLKGSVPRGASGPAISMSIGELDSMRDVFGTLSDSEIQSLYKRVMR